MAKGKKAGPQGPKITAKLVKSSLKVTGDGRTRLELCNLKIANFPKCILKFPDIDELNLSRNYLKKIPDTIQKFEVLLFLDLHSNKLDKIPVALCNLRNLYMLNLCDNNLTCAGLPDELGNLINLQVLNLGLNQLDYLPKCVGNLKELRELLVFNNRLTEIPTCIQSLTKLEKFNITSNRIPEEPEEDTIQRVEGILLVKEIDLCTDCLKKCKQDKENPEKQAKETSDQKKSAFGGLQNPNSVAQENEAQWR